MVLTQAGNTLERDKGDERGWGSRLRFISASWVASKSLLEVRLDSEGHLKTIDFRPSLPFIFSSQLDG